MYTYINIYIYIYMYTCNMYKTKKKLTKKCIEI